MSGRKALSKPAHPGLDDRWTVRDQARACREGWAIYEAARYGITVLEIERNDVNDPPYEDAPQFKSDEEAIAHVRRRAREGSRLHRRALELHRRWRRRWRVQFSQSDDEDGPAEQGWFDPVFALLASDACSSEVRARCAEAFETILDAARMLAKTDQDRESCGMLEDYIVNELGDD